MSTADVDADASSLDIEAIMLNYVAWASLCLRALQHSHLHRIPWITIRLDSIYVQLQSCSFLCHVLLYASFQTDRRGGCISPLDIEP